MQLVGMLDSPFVRRVAISARMLGLEYDHNPLSIFSGYKEFRELNPMVKVPTIICDNGEMLVDSTLIIDYFEALTGKSLMPEGIDNRQLALKHIGTSTVAMEKSAQLIYETKLRPQEIQYARWVERLHQQLTGALDLMEEAVGDGASWLFGDNVTQADLTLAVGWRFIKYSQPPFADEQKYPGLAAFSARAEALPEFIACPLS